jgi:hypothetical protein
VSKGGGLSSLGTGMELFSDCEEAGEGVEVAGCRGGHSPR